MIDLQLTSGVQRLDNLDVIETALAQPSRLRVADLALDEFAEDLGDRPVSRDPAELLP